MQILNPFRDKETDEDKLSILDILATDEHGRMLNIEVQTSLPAELPQRLAFYASSLYVDQLTDGAAYSDLRPAITICVLTQSMFRQLPGLHLEFRLREQSGMELTDNLQIHLLELPKLRVDAQDVRKATPIERWGFFLVNAEQLSEADIHRWIPDPEIVEAAGVLSMISQTPEAQLLYNARLKFQRDAESRLRKARQEGEEQGLEKGREQGVLVGRIAILQQLLELPESTIEELTLFSTSQLVDLEAQLQKQLRERSD